MKEYTIDATNKKLGRVASEAAKILIGKDKTSFARNIVVDVTVVVTNTSKADIPEKKLEQKTYNHYSGYPGGLKTESMTTIISKKGYSEIFRKAIYGMLPTNKLRAKRIKNLRITE